MIDPSVLIEANAKIEERKKKRRSSLIEATIWATTCAALFAFAVLFWTGGIFNKVPNDTPIVAVARCVIAAIGSFMLVFGSAAPRLKDTNEIGKTIIMVGVLFFLFSAFVHLKFAPVVIREIIFALAAIAAIGVAHKQLSNLVSSIMKSQEDKEIEENITDLFGGKPRDDNRGEDY